MFGPGMLGGFEDDPFFRGHFSAMQSMQDMMQGFGGGLFGGGALFGPPAVQYTDAMSGRRAGNSHQVSRVAADPFASMFAGVNPMMGGMMNQMGQMQRQMQTANGDPNSHFYSQSSVMSYSNTGQGPPKVYQASSSTLQAPGGVRETRKAVRDSVAGVEKMAIGHHIKDRGHVIERKRDTRTGEQEENQDLINLDDSERDEFDQEFKQKIGANSRHYQHSLGGAGRPDRHRSRGLPNAHGNYRYERSHPYDNHHGQHHHRHHQNRPLQAAITYKEPE